MRNLVDGGFAGEIHPINPKADEILGRKAYTSITDVPGDVDVAVFAIPAKFVPAALEEVGRKGMAGAILIPSGFAETGNTSCRTRSCAIAAQARRPASSGPNIYGYYYTPENLSRDVLHAVRRARAAWR